MTAQTLGVFMACGIFMMLLMLRLEASRFGAAEYDEPGRSKRGFWTRASWYVIGGTLIAALYLAHPAPREVLFLRIGRRPDVLLLGLALAAVGVTQAAAFARLRYGYLRLPPGRAYPGAALNAVGTAVIDEATFRGAVLGALIAVGVPGWAAIAMAAIVYLLATRLSSPGHHPYMPVLAASIGLVCGWATLATGGLGAAMIAHAVTSFAVFTFTGHAGQVPLVGSEPEEIASRRRPPAGWQDARRPLVAGRGAEPRGLLIPGQSGYREKYAPRPARTGGARAARDLAAAGATGISAGLGRVASTLRSLRAGLGVKARPDDAPAPGTDRDGHWRP